MTEDDMVGWHHRLNGHEFEQTLGVSEIQGSLAGCRPRGRKESDTTERLNNNHQNIFTMKVKVKVAQPCPTLCDPMDYTVHGILQARILEWVALPFSRGSSQPRDQTQVSRTAGGFSTS